MAYIVQNPDADETGIRDGVAPNLPMSTFYDTLARMEVTYKKRAKIQWFEHQLLPALRPGQVVLLDNAAFHRSPELQEIATQNGIKIIYLPAYSPDLNPIEKFWANLKRNIRKIIKAFHLTLSG